MKKSFFFLFLVSGTTLTSFAQNVWTGTTTPTTTSGSVGVGTTTPDASINVLKTYNGASLGATPTPGLRVKGNNTSTGDLFNFSLLEVSSQVEGAYFYVNNKGKVNVAKDLTIGTYTNIGTYANIGSALTVGTTLSVGTTASIGTSLRIGATAASGAYSGYTLSVAGDMIAKKCVIQVSSWADYVFDNDYHLPELSTVKTFIEKNNHLPGVPSEDNVLKDGVEMGEMNKILLQKVEELTLYIIKQNERIEQLEKKMNNN